MAQGQTALADMLCLVRGVFKGFQKEADCWHTHIFPGILGGPVVKTVLPL